MTMNLKSDGGKINYRRVQNLAAFTYLNKFD